MSDECLSLIASTAPRFVELDGHWVNVDAVDYVTKAGNDSRVVMGPNYLVLALPIGDVLKALTDDAI